ncbi:MAG: regulatory protein RecX [Candidatus Gracilibacteria bacterium]
MFNETLSDYEKLLQYAIWLISKKRYTCLEIQKKLQQFFKKRELKDNSASSRVIDRLKELNYLNDQKYAKDYVSDRVKFHPRGKFLLKRELKMKGISPEISMEVLADTEVDEFEMAIELLKKRKFNIEDELSQKEKARVYRFLASKGFNKEIIYKSFQYQYNRN